MPWIAYTYDHRKSTWQPAKDFPRVYRLASHIKAAIECKNSQWEIINQTPDLIECELVHYYQNPTTHNIERHTSPGTLVFINIHVTAARLPEPPLTTPKPPRIITHDSRNPLPWNISRRLR